MPVNTGYPILLGIEGDVKGKRFQVNESGLGLGRDPENQIHIDDTAVSRQHARFIFHNGNLWVQDLGARNGTFVNGERVLAQKQVSIGDRINAGRHVFLVRMEYSGAPRALAIPSHVSDSPDQHAPSSQRARRWRLWPFAVVLALLLLIVLFVISLGQDHGAGQAGEIAQEEVEDLLRSASIAMAEEQSAPEDQEDRVALSSLGELVTGPEQEPGHEEQETTWPPPPEGVSVAELVEQGHSLYRVNRLHEALVAYHQAMALDPSCEICIRRIDRLNTEITRAIEEQMSAGLRYYNNLQFQQAINSWEMVLLLSPDPESKAYKDATIYLEKARTKVQHQY